MSPEPTPQVFALPCPLCGQEAVYQLGVTYSAGNGVRMEAKLVKQCGCVRLAEERGEAIESRGRGK